MSGSPRMHVRGQVVLLRRPPREGEQLRRCQVLLALGEKHPRARVDELLLRPEALAQADRVRVVVLPARVNETTLRNSRPCDDIAGLGTVKVTAFGRPYRRTPWLLQGPTRRSSAVIRGHQRSSEGASSPAPEAQTAQTAVISGHQGSSEVIRRSVLACSRGPNGARDHVSPGW